MGKVKKTINSEVAKCIKTIGEDLIKRADDISRDLDHVATISIYSVICGGEIINYDVNKNYNVEAYIDYQGIKKMVNPMNSKFEERFNPPFASFKSSTGGYVVRPLDWEGVWNPDGELVSGNAIVKCFDKEYADLIVDTFNRYFDLIKENKTLKIGIGAREEVCISQKDRMDKIKNIVDYYGITSDMNDDKLLRNILKEIDDIIVGKY